MDADRKHACESLTPTAVNAYLRAHGWGQPADNYGRDPERSLVFTHPCLSPHELLEVPQQRHFGDYARRMDEVIAGIAKVEQRWRDVVRDIQEPGPGTPEAGAQGAIQRYRHSLTGLGDDMVADPDGQWVRFEDHLADPEAERLLRDRDELRSAISSWKAEEESWKQREAELLAEVEKLREQAAQEIYDGACADAGADRLGAEAERLRETLSKLEQELDRLREENEDLRAELACSVCGRGRGAAGSPLCECPDPATSTIETFRRQRDALADALQPLIVYVPGQIGDPARAVLKAAGRLR